MTNPFSLIMNNSPKHQNKNKKRPPEISQFQAVQKQKINTMTKSLIH
jgi:hypothetical protein